MERNKLIPKHGWKRFYADIMKSWGVGYGAVLGRFSGVINLALLASTYLLVKGFELSFIESILVGIGLVIFILVSGFVYLKLGLQKAEYSSLFLEQPELHEMYLRIQRMETKLDELLSKKLVIENE